METNVVHLITIVAIIFIAMVIHALYENHKPNNERVAGLFSWPKEFIDEQLDPIECSTDKTPTIHDIINENAKTPGSYGGVYKK